MFVHVYANMSWNLCGGQRTIKFLLGCPPWHYVSLSDRPSCQPCLLLFYLLKDSTNWKEGLEGRTAHDFLNFTSCFPSKSYICSPSLTSTLTNSKLYSVYPRHGADPTFLTEHSSSFVHSIFTQPLAQDGSSSSIQISPPM